MPIRYAPIGQPATSPTGQFVSFAEYEEFSKEFLELAVDLFERIERGEMTASDAEAATKSWMRLMQS